MIVLLIPGLNLPGLLSSTGQGAHVLSISSFMHAAPDDLIWKGWNSDILNCREVLFQNHENPAARPDTPIP